MIILKSPEEVAKLRESNRIAAEVMARMREMPIDYFGRPAKQRIDGRVTYDLDLYRVKSPQQSKGGYDFYEHVRTIKSEEAWLPVGAGGCKLGG